jgi:PKD repeat protein
MYSTYIGGSGDDAGYVLALNKSQTMVYVGGGTNSSNFTSSTYTSGAWKTSYQGGPADGYIARFANSGTYALQRVSYIGTNNYDQVYGVQVDLNNNVYAMGQSLGGAFPVSSGVYSNPGSTQFIIKMDSMLATNVFFDCIWFRHVDGDEHFTGCLPGRYLREHLHFRMGRESRDHIDSQHGRNNERHAGHGHIDTCGFSAQIDHGRLGLLFHGAQQKTLCSCCLELFTGVAARRLSMVSMWTVAPVVLTGQGVIYQAICGGCGGSAGPPLPMTSGSFSTSNGSSNCNLASLKIAFQLGAPNAIASASPNSKGCPPFTVQFVNTSSNAITYLWDFKDGSPLDTAFQPKHTFNNPGTYNVQLIVFNPNACKVRDTTYVQIVVDNTQITADFNFVLTDSCGPFRANFTNTSKYNPIPGSAGWTKFNWYFGDGTTFVGANPGSHSFPATGTYTVQLVMFDSAACNSPDTITKIVNFNNSRVVAGLDGPDSVCLKTSMVFQNTSTNATAVAWSFGDWRTSTNKDTVVVNYSAAGTYTIRMIAVNPATCNKSDTFTRPSGSKSCRTRISSMRRLFRSPTSR